MVDDDVYVKPTEAGDSIPTSLKKINAIVFKILSLIPGIGSGGATGGLTNAELRATAVPVAVGTTVGLTDGQLRASAIPVSMAVTPGLTDTQLRASAIPVALSSVQRTVTGVPHVVGGTIAAGCRALSFIASSDFVGAVLGIPLPGGAGLDMPVPPGDTIGAITFTRTAGTLYSLEAR